MLLIPKLDAGIPARELPADAGPRAVRSGVPGPRFPLQVPQLTDAAGAETLASDQAEFDFGLVEPTPVLRRGVHGQPPPQRPPDLGPQMGDQGFLAMGV